jgi:hypothetical protein
MIITVQKMLFTKNGTGSLSHIKKYNLFVSFINDLIAILRTGVRVV